MTVTWLVPAIATDRIDNADAFYGKILGMDGVMDLGWIVTYASGLNASAQFSIAKQGGSGAPVPDTSVEVNDPDDLYGRARAVGLAVEYGPTVEPWGVTRFFIRDPFG